MRGFSVLEMTIYIAVLVVASVVIVDSLLRVQPVFVRGQLLRSINTSGELILRRMTSEIRLANDIDASSSVFDANPGRLVLNTVVSEADNTPSTATFSLSSGQFQLQRVGQAAEILSSSDVSVTNMVFRRIVQGSMSKAVKIEFVLESKKGTTTVTSNFYGTAILKNYYKNK